MKLPEQKGLYWARVGDQWYIADVTLVRNSPSEFAIVQAAKASTFGMYFVSLEPEKVDEWGERILEPDPSPA